MVLAATYSLAFGCSDALGGPVESEAVIGTVCVPARNGGGRGAAIVRIALTPYPALLQAQEA